jgi:hypothetical protein
VYPAEDSPERAGSDAVGTVAAGYPPHKYKTLYIRTCKIK